MEIIRFKVFRTLTDLNVWITEPQNENVKIVALIELSDHQLKVFYQNK